MPKPILKNLSTIKNQNPELGDCLLDVQNALTNLSDATVTHPAGKQITSPPPIVGMNVVGSGGVHHVTISDGTAPLAKGVEYHLEVATTPAFTNAVGIALGPHRTYRGSLGSGPLYFQAYSQYPGSAPNTPYVHPVAVDAGGSAGPSWLPSTGSGTSSCTTPSPAQGAGVSSMRLGPDGRKPSL
jgi:hypothetical protein